MCGIVGAISQNNIIPILLDGLKRLEYRGYDSAGIATLCTNPNTTTRIRTQGKVNKLENVIKEKKLSDSRTGIAHTRWATHGIPSETNAHPHTSDPIMVVHNGIIENHLDLKKDLSEQGYTFKTDTDTEVIPHLIHQALSQQEKPDFLLAVKTATQKLKGAFALGIISSEFPKQLIAVRQSSPLIIGIGNNEHFIASDTHALLPVTKQFVYLEDGDIAKLTTDQFEIHNGDTSPITRKVHKLTHNANTIDRGQYRHFMQKEIFEQPEAIKRTLSKVINQDELFNRSLSKKEIQQLNDIEKIHIVACGTSYHAGLIGSHWIEQLSGIPCQINVASEYRYRDPIVEPNTLLITISQSGETADTLGALQKAKKLNYASTLTICNVPDSAISRASDFTFLTAAGTEIGVASTKSFTTQLLGLLLLSNTLGKNRKTPDDFFEQLRNLPTEIEKMLVLDEHIQTLAKQFHNKRSALFLGRGIYYPVAMEGALKLKELSYIHAEAYPAGELKHGPLALIDEQMPVVVVAPNDALLSKLQSNLNEVHVRGGQLIIFADETATFQKTPQTHIIPLPKTHPLTAPISYTIPLQLLSYHVALIKGTDVDQPRNLAKSVTVE